MGESGKPGASGGQKSTGTAVKEQGSQVAKGTSQTGQRVAHTAAEQGKQVVQETGRQAHNVVDQAQSQLMEQASAQQKRAASGLRSLGDQLRSAVDKSDQPGPADDLVRQASDRMTRVADWLEQREPGQVVDELREFARRRPGAFLGGAAVAGLLVGRFTRTMTSGGGGDQNDAGVQPGGQSQPGSPDGSGPNLADSPSQILAGPPSSEPGMAR
ncbi:hypothetical protein GCM10023322_32450 [Rugosimonospora acidiphila]|uniref:DUF3618 domain-containing protein n=1 Tax=Rugosimonospora acidiphila TaxID=556531 RepID=A0ABP9RT96_9ACTN